MPEKRLSKAESRVLELFWKLGTSSVREVLEALPEEERVAYTTLQTLVHRLEEKGAVRRVKKIGNAHIFEAVYTRKAVYRRLVDDLLEVFGGTAAPLMSHLAESGKLSLADVREAERILEKLEKKS